MRTVGQATSVGQARRGPVGAKKSEGGNASSSPSYIQVEPPPPLSPVLLCRFTLLLCKNPFQMTYIVHRYGQGAAAQQLARAVQTAGVGIAGMTLGKVTFDVPMVRQSGCAGRGRGRAVVACGVEAVTHFPHLIATHLHLLTQLTCNSAATPTRHRTTVTPPVHPPNCTALHQDRRFSFLLCCALMRTAVLLLTYDKPSHSLLHHRNLTSAFRSRAYGRVRRAILRESAGNS